MTNAHITPSQLAMAAHMNQPKPEVELPLSPARTVFDYLKQPPQNSRKLTISPAEAKVILESCNARNRPIRPQKVQQWAAKMRSNAWLSDGQTIDFDWNKSLTNGQHRLAAVIELGRPVEFTFRFGLDPAVYLITDTGVPRTGGDMLGHEGFKEATLLASALAVVYRYDNDMVLDRQSIPQADFVDMAKGIYNDLAEYSPGSRDSSWYVLTARRLTGKTGVRTIPPGTMAAMLYIFSRIDVRRCASFIDAMEGKSSRAGGAVNKLLKRMTLILANGGRISDVTRLALIYIAWNKAWIGQSGSMKDFEWSQVQDEFPTLRTE